MEGRRRETACCFSWCSAPAPSGPKAEADPELPSVLRKIEKWGDYAATGDVIRVSRGHGAGIIPMKTPLTHAQMSRLVASGKRVTHPHTLRAFVDAQSAMGRRVGLIVDLTCHECLYAEELEKTPWVRYVHLATPAKQFVEPWLIRKLGDEIAKLWRDDPGAYVAVHCSYGFARRPRLEDTERARVGHANPPRPRPPARRTAPASSSRRISPSATASTSRRPSSASGSRGHRASSTATSPTSSGDATRARCRPESASRPSRGLRTGATTARASTTTRTPRASRRRPSTAFSRTPPPSRSSAAPPRGPTRARSGSIGSRGRARKST